MSFLALVALISAWFFRRRLYPGAKHELLLGEGPKLELGIGGEVTQNPLMLYYLAIASSPFGGE